MRKKGFTLIELLAILVILAIIVLIALPSLINTTIKTEEIKNEEVLRVLRLMECIFESAEKNQVMPFE